MGVNIKISGDNLQGLEWHSMLSQAKCLENNTSRIWDFCQVTIPKNKLKYIRLQLIGLFKVLIHSSMDFTQQGQALLCFSSAKTTICLPSPTKQITHNTISPSPTDTKISQSILIKYSSKITVTTSFSGTRKIMNLKSML